MRKKLILFLVAALATCGTAGALSACSSGPESQVYNPGDTIIEEREGEFTYDEYGNLVGQKYTGKNITVKYLVSETAYITMTGEKASEMVVTGYSGDITALSVSDIENNIAIGNVRVSVTGIADGAFYGCETLETVDLTKTNSSLSFRVGDSAFANCVALESVKMPEQNVYTVSAEIGSRAFANNTALKSLELGNKLAGIGNSAFQNCIALTSVTIPESVTVINSRTFADCDTLASINVSANAKLKSIQDGAFTNTGINSLDLSSLSELRYIGSNAFSATKLSSVNLPESVSYVGDSAFYNCKNLSSVNIPFLGNSISRSNTFTAIYGVDGEDSRNLNVTVKSAVSVPMRSFAGMENITSLTISSFAKAGAYRIYEADGVTFNRVNLTEDEVNQGSDRIKINKVIGNYAFDDCENLTDLVLPADTEGLGDYAFRGCSALSTFAIPVSVKTIGDGTFTNCTAFHSMTIPASVTSVGNGAFYGCNNITALTIARLNGVEPVRSAYNVLTGYEYVNLSNIANWFGSNNSLSTITVNSLYTLPDSAFSGLNNLNNVNLTFKAIDETPFEGDNAFQRPSGIPAVSSLGDGAFRNCEALAAVTLTDADGIIENIGDNTFENCASLLSFTVPATVKTIGSEAFKGCSFTSFTVPASVYSVGNGALTGCNNLSSLTIEAYNQIVSELQGIVSVDTYKTIGSLGALFGNGDYAIPEYLTAVTLKNVNTLAANAFSGWENLVTLNIEFVGTMYAGSGKDSVPHYTTIGQYAFSGCENLTTLNVTGGANVKEIGSYAFNNCEKITSAALAQFTKVSSIGSRAFAGCVAITTVTLPGTLLYIGNNAFYNCPNVTVLNIGNYADLSISITNIFGATDNYVAVDNSFTGGATTQKYVNGVPAALETVTLNGIETLSDLSRSDFANLTMVKAIALNLSTDKTSLVVEESNPFSACTSLVKVFIPETITEIYFSNGVAVWGNGAYELGEATVYTYASSVTSYGNYWHYDGTAIVKYTAADYEGKTYTLNLDGGVLPEGFIENTGDAAVVESCPVTVEAGPLTADKLPELTKEGYDFIGWYDNSEFTGKPVSFPYYSTNSAPELYAKWVRSDSNKIIPNGSGFNTIGSNIVSDSNVLTPTFSITVLKTCAINITFGLDGARYNNGVLTVSLVTADGVNKTLFTINNDSGSYSDNEKLGLTQYTNSLTTKTLTVNLGIGDSLVINYSKYNTNYSTNYAYFTYYETNVQTSEVTKPEIPETEIPVYDASEIVEERGVQVTEDVFSNAITTFNRLSETSGFNATMTVNGITITEAYDFNNDRIEQVITYNGVSQTYYYVYDRNYAYKDGYNMTRYGATLSYLKLTDAQLAQFEELAKQEYPDDMADALINMLRGKWICMMNSTSNAIKPDSNIMNITTSQSDYEYDTENGVYWKVLNENNGIYKTVIAVTFDVNGNANIYLALYRYNELYLTIKSNDFNNTTVTLPSDINNAVDLEKLGDY